MRLQDKVIIVTGAIAEEGRRTALHCAEEGAVVIATDTHVAELEQLELELREISDKDHHILIHNISKEIDWERVVDEIIMQHGKIDGLVQFISPPAAQNSYQAVTVEDFRHEMESSVWGTYLALRNVTPVMEKEGEGHIVAVSHHASGDLNLSYSIEGALEHIIQRAALQFDQQHIAVSHLSIEDEKPFEAEKIISALLS